MAQLFKIGSRLREASVWEGVSELIAYQYRATGQISCVKCALEHDLVAKDSHPLYPIDFGIYFQACHFCFEIIAQGSCNWMLYPVTLTLEERSIVLDALALAKKYELNSLPNRTLPEVEVEAARIIAKYEAIVARIKS